MADGVCNDRRWLTTTAPAEVEVMGGYWSEMWDPHPTAASAHCDLFGAHTSIYNAISILPFLFLQPATDQGLQLLS